MRRGLEQAERVRRIFEKVKLAALVIFPIAAIAIINAKMKNPAKHSSTDSLFLEPKDLTSPHSITTTMERF